MTGFDETVPPDDADDDRDATAANGARDNVVDPNHERDPDHDSTAPAVEDAPEPDEPDEAPRS